MKILHDPADYLYIGPESHVLRKYERFVNHP